MKIAKSRYVKNKNGEMFTAGISVMYEKYDHINAIEFHHKEEKEAIALRDLVFDMLEKRG